MAAEIHYKKHAHKAKELLTDNEKAILDALELDLRSTNGKPLGKNWQHLGPLHQMGSNFWHCHFTHNKVAIWEIREDHKIVICQIDYVGDRGNAPY